MAKSIEQQFKEIEKEIVKRYSDIVKDAVEETGEAALIYIESVGDYGKHRKTRNYRKKFYLKDESSALKARIRLVNKDYQLTHLLERGHAIKGGTGRTAAFPHWELAEDFALKEFEIKLIRKLSKGADK